MATTKRKKEELTVVEIEGRKYYTFPQALHYTQVNRELLRQRIDREKNSFTDEEKGAVNAFNICRYVFVPVSVCEQLIAEKENEKTVEKLKKYKKDDLTKFEQFQELGVSFDEFERVRKELAKSKKK